VRGGRQTGEALWRFSLALYARPAVAEALLHLQDRAGRDVSLMLFCLWLGAVAGTRLDQTGLAAAGTAIRQLAAPVRALRGLRRELKHERDDDPQALRRRIAMLEIAAERQVQMRLAAASPSLDGRPDHNRLAAAAANLALYLGGEAASAEAEVLCRELASLTRQRQRTPFTPAGRP
jgi:uncharacterized protein (TIGR02444 family)